MPCSRRFAFKGDDAAYIWYLEDRFFALETSLHRLSRQDARIEALHPLRGQDNFVSNRGKDFEGARYHRSGGSGTLDGQGWDDGTQPEWEASLSLGDEHDGHKTEDADDERTGLDIVEYNPLSEAPKRAGCFQKRGGGQQLRVKSEFDSFLADLPHMKGWTCPPDEARRKIIPWNWSKTTGRLRRLVPRQINNPQHNRTSAEPVNIL